MFSFKVNKHAESFSVLIFRQDKFLGASSECFNVIGLLKKMITTPLFSVSVLIDQLSHNWPDSESWTVINFSE